VSTIVLSATGVTLVAARGAWTVVIILVTPPELYTGVISVARVVRITRCSNLGFVLGVPAIRLI